MQEIYDAYQADGQPAVSVFSQSCYTHGKMYRRYDRFDGVHVNGDREKNAGAALMLLIRGNATYYVEECAGFACGTGCNG